MTTEGVLLQSPFVQVQPSLNAKGQLLNLLLVVVLIGGMLFHLLTLTMHPRAFIDEAWLANASWTWLTTGVNFDSIHTGVLDQFGYEWVHRFFLGEAPFALSFSVLGLGLFQARLVTWFFAIVLLFTTVMASRRMHGLRVGLLAAIFLMVSLPFLQASRWRQDIMLTAFIMLSLWLALIALQDNKLWAHSLAGFLLGIGPDIHQSSMLFIPALAALYVVYYGKSVFLKRGTWIAGIGGIVGLAIFAAIHILPNPEVYSKFMSFNFASGGEAEFPITHPSTLVSSLLGELGRYGFRRNPIDLALIGLGSLWLLKRRSKADILLLVFTGVAFIDFVLLGGNKTNLYAIHLYPFFMLMISVLAVSLIHQLKPSRLLLSGSILALVAYLGYGTVRMVQSILSTRDYNYYAITDQIRTAIPPEARVMGMPTWWLGLADYDYRSSLSLTYYQVYNDYDVMEAMEVIRPDVIIVDETQMVVLQTEDEELPSGLNNYGVSEEQFLEFLETHGEMVLAFDNAYHGYFEIYFIHWDEIDP